MTADLPTWRSHRRRYVRLTTAAHINQSSRPQAWVPTYSRATQRRKNAVSPAAPKLIPTIQTSSVRSLPGMPQVWVEYLFVTEMQVSLSPSSRHGIDKRHSRNESLIVQFDVTHNSIAWFNGTLVQIQVWFFGEHSLVSISVCSIHRSYFHGFGSVETPLDRCEWWSSDDDSELMEILLGSLTPHSGGPLMMSALAATTD